jgi:uncharacterized membrane protein YoaK (UPF0700 family)
MPRGVEFLIVLMGGLWLALVAGYVNTLMVILGAPPVTHVTGSITRLSADLGRADYQDALLIATLVLSFVAGAVIAGVIVGGSTLKLGRRYGIAILLESALLGAAAAVLPHSVQGATIIAACAAGLQNALAASYRSLIIRTTHLTGVFTDIGFSLGRLLAGHQRPGWTFLLLGSIAVSFVVGGVIGALVVTRSGVHGLWFASIALLVMGLGYFTLRKLGRMGVLDTLGDPEEPG